MKCWYKKFITLILLSGIIFQSFLPFVNAQSLYDQKLAEIQAQADAIKIQAQSQIAQVQNQTTQTTALTPQTTSVNDALAKAQAIRDQVNAKTNSVQSDAQNQTQERTQAVIDAVQNKTTVPVKDNQTPIVPQSQPSKYTGADGDIRLNTGQISVESQMANNVNFNKAQAMLEQMQNTYDQVTTVFNDNENNINNKMDTLAVSGRNIVERNDGVAEILSGRVVVNSAAITRNNFNAVSTPAQSDDVLNDVTNKNKSLVENFIELTGDSGLNKINTNDGKAKIDTGPVDIRLNLLNLTNTNIVNSEWGQLFYQSFDPLNQDFDLAKGWKQAARNDCALGACEGEFRVNNVNEAVLNNKVKILGNSGGNEIIDSDGDGIIRTGDVKVSANLINFLNTNMTRSKWRLAVLNIFDDWKGDLILPGVDRFDNNENDYNLFPNSKITTENDAGIKNSVIIEANTGQNDISSNDGKFNIKTGTAVAKSNVSTVGNITFTGGDWYLVFINTFGGWRGYAVNIPDDIGTAQTEQGVIFSSLLSKAILGNMKNVKNDDGKLELITNNVAELNNELLIQALTGNNRIQGVDGDAEIQTGNALVLSNIFNFVNTTMYGGKWNLALINVFGNWEGNITFGRPNLKLTSVVQGPAAELKTGDAFTAKLIYENSGTADATEVSLKSNFDPKLFRVISSSSGAVIDQNTGKIVWNFDKLRRGATGETSFTLQALAKTVGTFDTKIVSSITGKEREWELRDNTIENMVKIKISESDIAPPTQNQPQNQQANNNQQNQNPQNNSSNNSVQNNQTQNSNAQTNSNTQSSSGGYYDANSSNNASASNNTSSTATPQAVELPKITIEKTNDAKNTLKPNDLVNYSIILKNIGNVDADEIIVKDTFKDSKGNIISADEYPIIALKSKEGTVIQYSIIISSAMPSGKYTNVAAAYVKDKNGKIVSTISASSVINVENDKVMNTVHNNNNDGFPANASEGANSKATTASANKQSSEGIIAKVAEIFSVSKPAKATSTTTSQKTAIARTEKSPAKSDANIVKIAYKEEQNPVFKVLGAGSNFLDNLSAHLPRLILLFGIWQLIANIHSRVYTSIIRRKARRGA